jgi:PAS domain-containing protein
MNFRCGEAWLLREGADALDLVSFYGPGCPSDMIFEVEGEKIRFTKGKGIPGKAWEIKNSLWSIELASEQYFIRKEAAEKAGIISGFAIPIPLDGEVLGVLTFYLGEKRGEDKELVKLLTAIAGQLGVVLKHKMAEDDLKLAERRYRSMIEAAPESIITFDGEGKIENVNRHTQLIFGYDRKELIAMPWHSLFVADELRSSKSCSATRWCRPRSSSDFERTEANSLWS